MSEEKALPSGCFQNTLDRFCAYSSLMPEYALAVFRVYLHTQKFQHIGKHTTNIAHLGAGRFAILEFPLPTLAEQEQIVVEVERHLSLGKVQMKHMLLDSLNHA